MNPEGGRDSQAVKVTLFGRQYAVRGHGSRDYVEKLVEFINDRSEKISEKTGIVSTIDIAILTLLNVTDELFECRRLISKPIRKMEEEEYGLLEPEDKGETDLKIPLRGS